MPQPPTTPAALPPASAFAEAFARVVGPLLTFLAANLLTYGTVTHPLHERLNRTRNRVLRLMTRLATGTWRPRRAAQRSGDATKPRTKPTLPDHEIQRRKLHPIPRGHLWIIRKFGWRSAAYASQLDHLLNTPETQALFAEAPPEAIKSLGRTLRPLCNLLGITPPKPLQSDRPPPIRKPRPKRPRKKPRKLRLRTPKMPAYPTTSSTPWRIVKSKTQKFWG